MFSWFVLESIAVLVSYVSELVVFGPPWGDVFWLRRSIDIPSFYGMVSVLCLLQLSSRPFKLP